MLIQFYVNSLLYHHHNQKKFHSKLSQLSLNHQRNPKLLHSPQKVDYKKSVIVRNLSYKVPPSNFVPVLESVGHVLKFVQGNGQLVAEFETKEDQVKAVEKTYNEWNGRIPRVIWMSKDFNFTERKK